ncbi:MAG: methyltransferase domain-containing protein [Pseudomonadota bacterium]
MKTNEQWHMAKDAADLYERIVARYVLGPWAPSLVDAAQPAQGERVLDLACGTGVVARIAAQRVGIEGRVIGIDLNPGMISVARSLSAPEGGVIEWREGSALAIPIPDASLDVVLCQQGLQFFPDKACALREMRRVIDRGGRLALSVWSSAGVYNTAVGKALAQYADEDTAQRFLASRNTPAKEEVERLALAAGFSDVSMRISRMHIHLPKLDRFALEHLAASPIAASIAELDSESRNNIGASVMREMQRFDDGDGVTYPEETYVLTASV